MSRSLHWNDGVSFDAKGGLIGGSDRDPFMEHLPNKGLLSTDKVASATKLETIATDVKVIPPSTFTASEVPLRKPSFMRKVGALGLVAGLGFACGIAFNSYYK